MRPYKQRLYDAYVSSGQAAITSVTEASPARLYSQNKPYAESVLRPLLPADKAALIIDLGCGSGGFLYHVKQFGYRNLIGVDASGEQVEVAHRLGMSEVRYEPMDAFLASHHTPADVVLLMDVIEHFTPQETFDLLDRVYTLLKPGGQLILHVPNAEGIHGMRIRYGDLTHEQCFTSTSMRQLLKAVGFQFVTCREDKPIRHSFRSGIRRLIWAVGTLPTRLLLLAETGLGNAILSQNMLVVAIK